MIDHTLEDNELINELLRLGGLPPEVLAYPDLLKLMMPIIGSDLRAHNEGHSLGAQRWSCPM